MAKTMIGVTYKIHRYDDDDNWVVAGVRFRCTGCVDFSDYEDAVYFDFDTQGMSEAPECEFYCGRRYVQRHLAAASVLRDVHSRLPGPGWSAYELRMSNEWDNRRGLVTRTVRFYAESAESADSIGLEVAVGFESRYGTCYGFMYGDGMTWLVGDTGASADTDYVVPAPVVFAKAEPAPVRIRPGLLELRRAIRDRFAENMSPGAAWDEAGYEITYLRGNDRAALQTVFGLLSR